MADIPSYGVRSTASIAGHPIHPMIVPFPIAFLPGALATDIVFATGGDPIWAVMSKWLIMAGLVTGAVAAVLGAIDFSTIKRARQGWIGWVHGGGNGLVMVLSLISLIARWNSPEEAALSIGLTLSIVVVLILGLTGWLGGELVFRRKIGVVEEPQAVRGDRHTHIPHPAE